MLRCLPIVLSVLLFADADVSWVSRFREPAPLPAQFPPKGEISVLSALPPAPDDRADQSASGTVQPESRLAIIRYVSGEFVRVVKPLPGGKQGFLLKVGQPLNQEQLDRAVATHGAVVNSGEKAQITRVEFRDHQIIVDVNGGGRTKRRWRDHISFGIGGGPGPAIQSSPGPDPGGGPSGVRPGAGSTLYVEFGKQIPNLTPDELKKILSPLLDFSKQRSAAMQWIDTLPPEFQKAIKDRRAALGMDREMVIAVIGRSDNKVRERDTDGNEIEDWIYGQPPSKTVFVRFQGDRVTSIKEFP